MLAANIMRSLSAAGKYTTSGSNHLWDGIVGAMGEFEFNEKWCLPFHFDVGIGDIFEELYIDGPILGLKYVF